MVESSLAELDANLIHSSLKETCFANGFHHFQTIDSTNTHALDQARQGAVHGNFYLADEQTAGRGRSDHQWHSAAAQGLYLSVLLRVPAEQLAWLPLVTAFAAHSAIHETTNIVIDLRWPNDLLINEKKAGGILVETTTGAAVVGIGINLHQKSFPESLATAATSLTLETSERVNRQELLIAFLQALNNELANKVLATLPERTAAISSWVEGRSVEVHGPQACVGITAGLDQHGFLRVLTTEGLVTVTTGGIRAAKP